MAVYVGIASVGLASRLAGYLRPGPTQRTNWRVGALLLQELEIVEAIDILAAEPADSGWNGLPISNAAGLETGLIASYHLPWNLRGA